MPNTIHDTSQYANNRAEISHEPTRQRERTMRGFKSMGQAQRFLAVHGTMRNLFAIPQHLMRAKHYRLFRTEAFDMYQQRRNQRSTYSLSLESLIENGQLHRDHPDPATNIHWKKPRLNDVAAPAYQLYHLPIKSCPVSSRR